MPSSSSSSWDGFYIFKKKKNTFIVKINQGVLELKFYRVITEVPLFNLVNNFINFIYK